MSRLGQEILQGLQEALEYSTGAAEGCRTHVVKLPKGVNVRDLRARLRMTQQEFADRFGFSVYSISNCRRNKRRRQTLDR